MLTLPVAVREGPPDAGGGGYPALPLSTVVVRRESGSWPACLANSAGKRRLAVVDVRVLVTGAVDPVSGPVPRG